jgi:hypothetical protein
MSAAMPDIDDVMRINIVQNYPHLPFYILENST